MTERRDGSVMEKPIRILNVEDESVDHMALVRFASERGLAYSIDWAQTLAKARELAMGSSYDIVLLDYKLPDGTGLELIDSFKLTPIIFITGSGDEMVAVQAIKGGAADYIVKDNAGRHLELVPVSIEKALHMACLERERKEADERQRENMAELERMNRLMTNRELRLMELKAENDKLHAKLKAFELKKHV